ncbi:MAG TPA: sigma 54-interacting transcriptional regulator [Vicinamibacterales bacterium]|jgi:transcriptional regulator with PAS, ATPase and Fis domain|nr:sigma 54-interacting transcriptional regulator [Vicinamibacterales bacterium]
MRTNRRGADKRRGVSALVGAVARGLAAGREAGQLRERFEEELRSLVRARSIAVRDEPEPAAAEVMCFDIPASASHTRARVEAVFEPARMLDGWTCQILESATQLAALLLEVERAQGRAPLSARNRADGAAPLIGSSPAIRDVRDRIERVAATDFCVLIEGESGTGKELVARQIHELSRRRRGPFVAVNCAAIVETLLEAELFGIEDRTATGVRGRRGKFEHAHDGTLFLDEVSDLSPSAQAKLLRAIQDLSIERVGACGAKRVDTRIIVATNRPLSDLVARGSFRLDLYYRLHGVEVQVPPLRARRDDIPELAQYFLERHRLVRSLQLSVAATDALIAYHWPGNVRELERVMERAIALAGSDFLELDDLPPALTGDYGVVLLPGLRESDTMRAWASRYARLVLERCQNNKRRACRELGISYHTLRAHLQFRPELERSRLPPED